MKTKKQIEFKPKTFAGIPVNWDWKNWHKGLWNPEDETLIVPRRVGIGWTMNLHAALKKAHLIKPTKKS